MEMSTGVDPIDLAFAGYLTAPVAEFCNEIIEHVENATGSAPSFSAILHWLRARQTSSGEMLMPQQPAALAGSFIAEKAG